MSESEVARLRQQIEAECLAAQQGLQAFASVARHEIITHRFNQVGALADQLAQHVGEEEANAIAAQIYMHVSEGPLPKKEQGYAPEAEIGENTPLTADPSDSAYPEGPGVQEEETITVTVHLKWEG